jgi:thymidylate kinase
MDTTIDEFQIKNSTDQQVGMVVELVGVAGVGKSTLYQSLEKKGFPNIKCVYTPPVWKISTIPFYLKNILSLLPIIILQLFNRDRQLTRREIAFLAILNGWHIELRKEIDKTKDIIIIDQGPISLIAHLYLWGPKSLFDTNMQDWWEKIYNYWGYAIDTVVMLDTSDDELKRRVNYRPQDHFLKGETDSKVIFWNSKYRVLYEEIVNKLASNSQKIRVIRIDSGKNSADAIMKIILPELGMKVDTID